MIFRSDISNWCGPSSPGSSFGAGSRRCWGVHWPGAGGWNGSTWAQRPWDPRHWSLTCHSFSLAGPRASERPPPEPEKPWKVFCRRDSHFFGILFCAFLVYIFLDAHLHAKTVHQKAQQSSNLVCMFFTQLSTTYLHIFF